MKDTFDFVDWVLFLWGDYFGLFYESKIRLFLDNNDAINSPDKFLPERLLVS